MLPLIELQSNFSKGLVDSKSFKAGIFQLNIGRAVQFVIYDLMAPIQFKDYVISQRTVRWKIAKDCEKQGKRVMSIIDPESMQGWECHARMEMLFALAILCLTSNQETSPKQKVLTTETN